MDAKSSQRRHVTFKLADRLGNENLIIEVGKSSLLRLLIRDPVTHNLQDAATRLLH
jgi:hypothetical protein